MEVRNGRWLRDQLLDLLREHGVALVLNNYYTMPDLGETRRRLDPQTADFLYIRFLGDRKKMDEYLTSVREVERMTKRSAKWQSTPKPKVDKSKLDVDVDETSPREYLTVMYELIALALQTDSTRVVTFQTACEEVGVADRFPSAIGITKGAHGLSHGKKEFGDEARYIGFLNEMHANFIKRLDSIQEGESTLLDNTLCFYGCATSKTHRAVNYPIILSGGSNLGFQHGSHLNFDEERIPLANLFVTIANQLGTPTEQFAGSTGDITEVLA